MRLAFMPLSNIHWPFVEEALGLRWVDGTKGIIVYDLEQNTVAAGVVFQNWTHTSVQIHNWISNPIIIRHGLYEEIYRYAFIVAEKKMLLATISSKNERSMKLNSHVGMVEVFRIMDGYDIGDDMVIFQGTPETLARWKPPVEVVHG